MVVYVGTIEYAFGRMVMFHMASPDLDALHKMADAIGINRKWFQNHQYNNRDMMHPHYDICKSKKVLAIKKGAVEINDRELVKICFPKMHFAICKERTHCGIEMEIEGPVLKCWVCGHEEYETF